MKIIPESRRLDVKGFVTGQIPLRSGGLLVPEGISSPLFNVAALTWFNKFSF